MLTLRQFEQSSLIYTLKNIFLKMYYICILLCVLLFYIHGFLKNHILSIRLMCKLQILHRIAHYPIRYISCIYILHNIVLLCRIFSQGNLIVGQYDQYTTTTHKKKNQCGQYASWLESKPREKGPTTRPPRTCSC